MRGNAGFERLLQTRFGTGKRFTRSYLQYFEKAQALHLRSEADWNALDSTRRMWFDYAMSTNQRGRDLIQYLEGYRNVRGARYLDIGCGFGGYLVAAARHGAECVGLEIDPQRAGFSRDNVADFNLRIPVHDLDALTPGIEQRLGRFDIITCNDVAEHVDSAEKLIANLARLLNPGGIAYLEVPNGNCIDFVAHDGHFGLFGITLLDRERARAYHWERFRTPYDVGDYWKLEDYFAFFERAGLGLKLVDSLYHPVRQVAEIGEQLRLLEEARKHDPALDEAYDAYRARIERDRAELDDNTFRNRYLRNFWTFIATM